MGSPFTHSSHSLRHSAQLVAKRVFVLSTNHKGAVTEIAIAHEAVSLGVEVFKPLSEHSKCDLVFELERQLFGVQCKTAARNGEVLCVNLVSNWHTPGGYVRHRYEDGDFDLLAIHSHELDRNFLIPYAVVAGASGIQLRLSPPKNAQRAAIHLASAYTFSGAVAQLAERCRGTAEATGSNPVSSTPEPTDLTVGANRFRNHFGYYMERAEAGEEIAVTRRGKPIVKLVAHQPELPSRVTRLPKEIDPAD